MFNKINEISILTSECKLIAKTAYLYKEVTTGKEFVLKVEQKEEWEISQHLLESEFNKLVNLSYEPEIANVEYLVKVDNNRIGYLMEYIKGITLKDYLSKTEFIEYEKILSITREILFALEKAHHHGISHQDLHNENIMINNLGYVKLIDFLDIKQFSLNDNFEEDIEKLKKICTTELYPKLEKIEDKRRFLAIIQYIFSLNELKDSSRELKNIIELVDELMYFDFYVFRLLSIFFNSIDKNKLNKTLYFTTSTKTFTVDNIDINNLLLSRRDLYESLDQKCKVKMNPLLTLNLCIEPIFEIKNINENLAEFNILFKLTPKAIKYKRLIDKYKLFDIYISELDKTRDICDILFIDMTSFLNEVSYQIQALEDVYNFFNSNVLSQ